MAKRNPKVMQFELATEVNIHEDEQTLAYYNQVDVAFREAAKLEKKSAMPIKVYVLSRLTGRIRIYPDEAWKWGSKTQRAPRGY